MVIQLFASFVMLDTDRHSFARSRKVQSASFSNPLFEFTKCVWRKLPREKLLPLLFWWIRENLCVQRSRFPTVLLLRCSSETFRDFALSLLLTNFLESYRITNFLSVVSYFQRKRSKQFSCNNVYLCKIFNLIINIISDLIY